MIRRWWLRRFYTRWFRLMVDVDQMLPYLRAQLGHELVMLELHHRAQAFARAYDQARRRE